MAQQKIISANPIRNGGMSVLYGGTISGRGPCTNAPGKSIVGAGAQDNGNHMATGATAGAMKAVSAATYLYSSKVLAAKYTSSLGGIANSALKFSDAPNRRNSPHKIEGLTTRLDATKIRASQFDIYTGAFIGSVSGSTDSFGNDHAARPTKTTPGELAYMMGKRAPVQADYAARTTF